MSSSTEREKDLVTVVGAISLAVAAIALGIYMDSKALALAAGIPAILVWRHVRR